jgi:hypothetical protein
VNANDSAATCKGHRHGCADAGAASRHKDGLAGELVETGPRDGLESLPFIGAV